MCVCCPASNQRVQSSTAFSNCYPVVVNSRDPMYSNKTCPSGGRCPPGPFHDQMLMYSPGGAAPRTPRDIYRRIRGAAPF